jgi:DNA-binding response OmpR family regulator
MSERSKVVAFDVDASSLASLRQAFPECEIQEVAGASTGSLERDWNPGPVDLLVVGDRARTAEMLGLCRGLRSQTGRADTPLLVLVSPAREEFVREALEAGADSCLVLPVHPTGLVRVVTSARAGNQPGRHTLHLDRAQHEDPLRDVGGEA